MGASTAEMSPHAQEAAAKLSPTSSKLERFQVLLQHNVTDRPQTGCLEMVTNAQTPLAASSQESRPAQGAPGVCEDSTLTRSMASHLTL